MSKEKAKVTIVAQDGERHEFESDSVICFGVDDAEEFLRGKAEKIGLNVACMGRDIPDPVFCLTAARMFGDFIYNTRKDEPLKAAEFLREVGRRLNKKGMNLYLETELGKPVEKASTAAELRAAASLVADNSEAAKLFLEILRPGLFKD